MAPLSISLGVATETTGLSESEIVLGMSAAFSGPSRGLGIELYRGASAYFTHVNRAGGGLPPISGPALKLEFGAV